MKGLNNLAPSSLDSARNESDSTYVLPTIADELVWYTEEGLENATFRGTLRNDNIFYGSGTLSFVGRSDRLQQGKWPELPIMHLEVPKSYSMVGTKLFPPKMPLQLTPRIAYTNNHLSSKKQPPESLVSLDELLPRENLISALITTFAPWDKEFFMDNFDQNVELTVIMECDQSLDQVWWCHNPLHFDTDIQPRCSACQVELVEIYTFCWTCSINICQQCNLLPALIINGLLPDDCPEHYPTTCYTTTQKIISAKNCSCIRKQSLQLVKPYLALGVYSIFHAKLMILEYSTHLRVIISSFNTSQDRQWDDMTDSFFYQDYLYAQVGKACNFFSDLQHFVERAGALEWSRKLQNFKLDLTQLDANIRICMTVPKVRRSMEQFYGMEKLKEIFKLDSTDYSNCPVIVQAFSLGGATSNREWMTSFANSIGCKLGDLKIAVDDDARFFDPVMTLRKQNMLYHLAETDNHQRYHSKMMWRIDELGKNGWLYLGSHNLSKASWGDNLWELGIIWKVKGSLASIPLPFNGSAIHKFSYHDPYRYADFNGRERIVHGYAIVSKLLFTSVTFRIAVVGLKETLTASINKRNWKFNESFPHETEALYHVRVKLDRSLKTTLVWIERQFNREG
jgi:hypothetical protein